MHRLSRATALKIASVISFLLGVALFVQFIPFLVRGAADLNQAGDAPPYAVIIMAFVFATVRIVAAYGVWYGQRWGIVWTLLANALDAVAAVLGVSGAPTTLLRIASILTVAFSMMVIVLCLWRDRKLAIG